MHVVYVSSLLFIIALLFRGYVYQDWGLAQPVEAAEAAVFILTL